MQPLLTATSLAAILRRPPDVAPVYHAYNQLRQLYVLDECSRHFASRADDPAPLYGKTMLDVGCGASTISQFLSLAGAEVTAIDPNPAVLAEAQLSAESYGTPITFIQTRAEDLVRQPQRYDVILALDLLEETADPAKMLWLLGQLLAPGGLLIVSAINKTFSAWLLHILLSGHIYGRTPRGQRQWSRFYRPAVLQQLAERHGLTLSNQQFLRFSLKNQQWALTRSQHGTRYLLSFTRG